MRALNAAAVARWAATCVHNLDVLRVEIDTMNVYPVADSDTGTNLLRTFAGARDELAARPDIEDAGSALSALASGAVAAAKGNSGVIISQLLRGFAEAVGGNGRFDNEGFAAAVVNADLMAAGAVAVPVPGTMLTVLHVVAEAVATADPMLSSLTTLTEIAARAAAEALAETPRQLPALAAAGVVDAGGRGLVAVLDALVATVAGDDAQRHGDVQTCLPASSQDSDRAWEVMYQLPSLPEGKASALRAVLCELGDSVTVAGDGQGNHTVHVHCVDIGAAIEAGMSVGLPRQVRVEPLLTPVTTSSDVAVDRAVVAIVRGVDLAELLKDEGISVLPVAQGKVPSTEELLSLIAETGSTHVTLLPGGAELTLAAERAAGHVMTGDKDVVVVPCASAVQVLAALAVHDAQRRKNDDVVAMAESAAATRRGEVRIAEEEAISWVGMAHTGDILGLVDGEVAVIEPGPCPSAKLFDVAMDVLARMLAVGGELVTLLTGLEAPEGVEKLITERLGVEHPEVELVCYSGGHADSVLLIGVE